MLNDILDATGIPYKETRFIQPPKTTYAVYNDTYATRGSDFKNMLKEHDITVELYEYKPDKNAEQAIENRLDARGIEYTKQERYFIDSEQLYQVIYEFSYIEKMKGA